VRADSARVALEAARFDYGPVQAVSVPSAAAVAAERLRVGSTEPAGTVGRMEAHWDVAAAPEPAGLDAAVPKAARRAGTVAGSADAALGAVLGAGSIEPVDAAARMEVRSDDGGSA
jgi:hypothetical protein